MSLKSRVKKGAKAAIQNLREKRYIQNYPNDILAGFVSRVTVYAVVDNAFLGVPDEKVLGSAWGSLKYSLMGWSALYTFGHSLLAHGLGDFYDKHKKKIDATYSGLMTFGFGMVVNMGDGNYTFGQALAASSLRTVIGIGLGPITRECTDIFRDSRGEPPIKHHTKYEDMPWRKKIPRLAAITTLPVAAAVGTLYFTPNNQEDAIIEYQSRAKKTNSIEANGIEFIVS